MPPPAPITKSARALLAAFNKKYDSLAPTIEKIVGNMMDPLAYGAWKPQRGGGYVFTKNRLNAGKTWPISVSQVHEHFLGATKDTHLWYNSLLPTINGRLFAVPMLDIDAKHGEPDAWSMSDGIRALLPCCKIFAEASTGGKGVHGYLALTFPSRMTATDIRDAFLMLQRFIKKWAITVYRARFDKVNGSPPIKSSRGDYLKYGTLATLPLLTTMPDALSFVDVCTHPCEWEVLELALLKAEHDCSPHSSYALLSLPPINKEKKKEEAHRKSEGSKCSPSERTNAVSDDCAFERSRQFAYAYCRRVNRAAAADELVKKDERAELATGPRTAERVHRFESIAEYIASGFRPSKVVGPLHYLPLVASRLTQKAIDFEFGKKHNRSRLLMQDVALVYWMLSKNESEDGTIQLPRNAVVALSRKLWKDGDIERVVDHKRFAAAKRLLCQVGLVEELRQGRKGHGCSKFRLCCVKEAVALTAQVDAAVEGVSHAVPQPKANGEVEAGQAEAKASPIKDGSSGHAPHEATESAVLFPRNG
jgi:hypothetical protein